MRGLEIHKFQSYDTRLDYLLDEKSFTSKSMEALNK